MAKIRKYGGKATEAASEIPLGQEGFAKYTIPTKPDKSSKTAKGAAAGGAAAGDEDGEHRDVYDIADKISVRNAVKSGLIPAWAEMTIKPVGTVKEMNK